MRFVSKQGHPQPRFQPRPDRKAHHVYPSFAARCFRVLSKREFKKLQRQGQRERHKTIGFNEKKKGSARAF